MGKKAFLGIIMATLILVCILGFWMNKDGYEQMSGSDGGDSGYSGWDGGKTLYVPVIDPGHGGPDTGATSYSGLHESDINLDMGLRMAAFMRFLGINPVMTRENDISIHDKGAKKIKNSDLSNRAEIVNSTPNSILISLHQNMYEEQYVKGLETYYRAGDERSKELAQFVQSSVNASIPQTGNRSIKVKKSGENYLLDRVTRPAVLVECGFISNPEDEANIISPVFQTKLTIGLTVAYLNWTEGVGQTQ